MKQNSPLESLHENAIPLGEPLPLRSNGIGDDEDWGRRYILMDQQVSRVEDSLERMAAHLSNSSRESAAELVRELHSLKSGSIEEVRSINSSMAAMNGKILRMYLCLVLVGLIGAFPVIIDFLRWALAVWKTS